MRIFSKTFVWFTWEHRTSISTALISHCLTVSVFNLLIDFQFNKRNKNSRRKKEKTTEKIGKFPKRLWFLTLFRRPFWVVVKRLKDVSRGNRYARLKPCDLSVSRFNSRHVGVFCAQTEMKHYKDFEEKNLLLIGGKLRSIDWN